MDELGFHCPQCGHAYPFAPHLAGKRGRCKSCQAVFRIPEAPPSVPNVLAAASPPPHSRPADDGKIAFNCPICGRGYRLDAKLAGKPERCISCQGIFTVPPQPVPTQDRPSPAAARGVAARPPATGAGAEDPGWWGLDSTGSTPAATARGGVDRRWAAAVAATPPPILDAVVCHEDEDDVPVVTATRLGPARPKWVLYATIGAGAVAGAVAFAVTFLLVSGAVRSTPPAVADQPVEPPAPTTPPAVAAEPAPTTPPAVVAEPATSNPTPRPAPPRDPLAEQHREAVEAIVRAYDEIADGYARIRDAGSIADGNAAVARGVADLRSASERGKSLPPLPPGRRQVLAGQAGPAVLRAVDRVLGELRRLKATPGLRSEFDRLIDAYTRTREAIWRQVDPF